MAIGVVMETRRVELGWTQVELGQRAGVDARQIRRYESGEAQPTIAIAQAIARALGITLDELVGDAPGWNGLWWSVWEGLAAEPVRGPLDLLQRGHTVVMQAAGVRAPNLEGEVLRCDGNLLAEPDSLAGWFDLRYGDLAARGTLQLRRHGDKVSGAWVRLSLRQSWTTGTVGLGRTPADAERALLQASDPEPRDRN